VLTPCGAPTASSACHQRCAPQPTPTPAAAAALLQPEPKGCQDSFGLALPLPVRALHRIIIIIIDIRLHHWLLYCQLLCWQDQHPATCNKSDLKARVNSNLLPS
jgi:hypothetical protein